MATNEDLYAAEERTDGPTDERVPRFGAATPWVSTIGIFAVATISWWLLGDPEWSFFSASAPVITCLLFWTLLSFIFTGFTFGNFPFSKLPQPLAGVAQAAANVALGVVITLIFTRVVGDWDATFSAATAGGAGYTAAAFIVLVGFYAFSLPAVSWGGYPFEGVPAPLSGLAQFFMAAFITTVGVVVLIYPNFNATIAGSGPVSLPTALGWVYSCIVVTIVSAMQLQNCPWAGIANRHVRALAAVVVTAGGGYVLYLVLKVVVKALAPSSIDTLPTYSASIETAQLGVFFSLWALILGLIFGPGTSKQVAAARAIRVALVVVLAIVSYVLFTRFLATSALHFPALDGKYGGDPLVFANWTILIVLWHAVAFGGFFGTRAPGRRGR